MKNFFLNFWKQLLLWGSISFLGIFFLLSLTYKNQVLDAQNSVVFVLDVSQSMQVQDVGEKTRLDAAKEKILETLRATAGTQFALTIFAGESMRILPFTTDINLFATFLNGLSQSNLTKQGSRIDLALQDALENFTEDKTGTIVLLTDGDESEIKIPSTLKDTFSKKNINLIIIGVGTKQGGYIMTGDVFSPYKLYKWSPVVAQLNESGLKKISSELWWSYTDIFQDIPLETLWKKGNQHEYFFLLLFSFFLWLWYLGISVFEIYKK